ncbi:MAG: DUF2271 domain-containing protein [Clostridia bacterium]|nr:DUF2271 domain-containing protein [Clostridia bacterium]
MKKATFSGTKSILCKILLCLLALLLAAGTAFAEDTSSENTAGIEISFTYQRGTTIASNQLAVWVEDAEGAVVKTLLVTDFTAGRRGYRNRTMSLPVWVAASDPESMTDEEIDTVSGATPGQGELVYVWDFTNQSGERVPDGIYTVHVEGTFYWESDVLYTAVIDTTNLGNEIPVEIERTAPDTHENENMISDVTIKVI